MKGAGGLISRFWKLPEQHDVIVQCTRGHRSGWFACIYEKDSGYRAYAETQSKAMQKALSQWESKRTKK